MKRSLAAAGIALLLMFPSAVCAQEEGTAAVGQRITEEQIRESPEFQELSERVTVLEDCEVLDFPGRKDGQPVGEILELDEVERTASIQGEWSRITFSDMDGANKTGYVPTAVLDVELPETEGNITEVDGDMAGALSPSSGRDFCAGGRERHRRCVGRERSAGRNAGGGFLRCFSCAARDVSHYPLLSLQYLLRSLGKRHYLYRSDGNHKPHHCGGSHADSLWFAGGDQRAGVCGGGLRRRHQDQLY